MSIKPKNSLEDRCDRVCQRLFGMYFYEFTNWLADPENIFVHGVMYSGRHTYYMNNIQSITFPKIRTVSERLINIAHMRRMHENEDLIKLMLL